MNVHSELVQAQFELLSTDPATRTKGRIWYNTADNCPKVDDGTSIHKMLTSHSVSATDIKALLRDTIFHVGQVITSMVDEADFISDYGDKWIMMKGQVLAASNYSVLALRRPEWVSGGDITIPDARNMTLKMLPHGRSDAYKDETGRVNIPGNTQEGNVGEINKNILYAKTDTSAGSFIMPLGKAVNIDNLFQNPWPGMPGTYPKLSTSDAIKAVHNVENRVQNIGVNYFIKVQ